MATPAMAWSIARVGIGDSGGAPAAPAMAWSVTRVGIGDSGAAPATPAMAWSVTRVGIGDSGGAPAAPAMAWPVTRVGIGDAGAARPWIAILHLAGCDAAGQRGRRPAQGGKTQDHQAAAQPVIGAGWGCFVGHGAFLPFVATGLALLDAFGGNKSWAMLFHDDKTSLTL